MEYFKENLFLTEKNLENKFIDLFNKLDEKEKKYKIETIVQISKG